MKQQVYHLNEVRKLTHVPCILLFGWNFHSFTTNVIISSQCKYFRFLDYLLHRFHSEHFYILFYKITPTHAPFPPPPPEHSHLLKSTYTSKKKYILHGDLYRYNLENVEHSKSSVSIRIKEL